MDRLGELSVRVLAVVLRGGRGGRPPKIRELRDATGLGIGTVVRHLAILRDCGLVSWQGGRKGTLRPTCSFVSADELD